MIVKGLNDEGRTFTGLASTWNQDVQGDIIERGAFKATLADWRATGRMIPLLDSHAWQSVRAVVGKLIDAKETDEGLLATWELIDGPDGDEVYRRIKGGFVDGLSIGFEIEAEEKPSEDLRKAVAWRILKRVRLMEVSVVVWPANEQSRVKDVKSAMDGINPSRLTEEDCRELRALSGRIGNLLRAAVKSAPRDEEAGGPEEDAPQGVAEAKAEDPPVEGPDVTPPPADSNAETKSEPAPEWVREALALRFAKLGIGTQEGAS
jgi:HK97 family phage prohead protease